MFVEHKEVGEVTEAPAKTLKLSEAVRKSMALFPVQGASWDARSPCALCGAAYAVGYDDSMGSIIEFVRRMWPLLDSKAGIPNTLRFEIERRNIMRRLEGNNGENRPQIADWLEAQGL
jgi:hypothetical protein